MSVGCRLSDQDPGDFLVELADALGSDIGVATLMGFTSAQSSAETGLCRVIEEVTGAHHPDARAVVLRNSRLYR